VLSAPSTGARSEVVSALVLGTLGHGPESALAGRPVQCGLHPAIGADIRTA
jgi:hypothetical protein